MTSFGHIRATLVLSAYALGGRWATVLGLALDVRPKG